MTGTGEGFLTAVGPSSMSNPLGEQRDRVLAIRMLLERRDHERRLTAVRSSPSASATGARVGSLEGMPTVEQALRGFRRPADAERARVRTAAARRSSWNPVVFSANFKTLAQEVLVRFAVDAEQADGRRQSPAASGARRYAGWRRAFRWRACRPVCQAPARHRPAADRPALATAVNASNAYVAW